MPNLIPSSLIASLSLPSSPCTLSHRSLRQLAPPRKSSTMTHLLPPNLLRLFVPRPPLSVVDALPEDVDPNAPPRRSKKIRPLEGVAGILERVKQEAADKGETTEVEEELTYAEQTKRELRKEARKKAVIEARKRGEEACELLVLQSGEERGDVC